MIKIAINGMGRTGRETLKALLERPEAELACVNDLNSAEHLAYLLNYDLGYGRCRRSVKSDGRDLIVDGKKIRVFAETDPLRLPWKKLGIDTVFECTGRFPRKDSAQRHLQAGAKRVIIAAAFPSEEIYTIAAVPNNENNGKEELAISSTSRAACCILPIVEIMDRALGVRKAVIMTIPSRSPVPQPVPGPVAALPLQRAATGGLVPDSAAGGIATTRAFPQSPETADYPAVPSPRAGGSLANIVFFTDRMTTLAEVNRILEEGSARPGYQGIVGVSSGCVVPAHVFQDSTAAIVNLETTQVVGGDLVKLMTWYDNEWGYLHRMLRNFL